MLRISRRTFLGAMVTGADALPVLSRPAQVRRPVGALDRQIRGWMATYGVPGAAVAVIQGGRLEALNGFGLMTARTTRAVTGDTIFEAASLGKPLFAYLVLTLVDAGVLSLDTAIGDYFRAPDFLHDARVERITPRMVLAHQTGLANWRPAREPDRFRFDPGSGFAYSGEAYVRLQRFVEDRTGRALTDLTTAELFAPLGMTRSSYVWREGYADAAADGHTAAGEPRRTRLWAHVPANPGGPRLQARTPPLLDVPNAAASLFSSAADYARFVLTVLGTGDRRVSDATLDLMFTPMASVNESISWGLGWGLGREGRAHTFWHWGNNNVYQSFVVGSRERRSAVVVLTNSARGLRLCREVTRAVLGYEHPAFTWNQVLPSLE